MQQLFLDGQRQSLLNNLLYLGQGAGPRQLTWLCYLLSTCAQGTDTMSQRLPPLPRVMSACAQGREKFCSGLSWLLSGALVTASPPPHIHSHICFPLARSHLSVCLVPLHLISVISRTCTWFSQRCWGTFPFPLPLHTSPSWDLSSLYPVPPNMHSGLWVRAFAWPASQRTLRS